MASSPPSTVGIGDSKFSEESLLFTAGWYRRRNSGKFALSYSGGGFTSTKPMAKVPAAKGRDLAADRSRRGL